MNKYSTLVEFLMIVFLFLEGIVIVLYMFVLSWLAAISPSNFLNLLFIAELIDVVLVTR